MGKRSKIKHKDKDIELKQRKKYIYIIKMSLIKSMNDIISKNKLVFGFILGLLTCYLIFNYGSCKEGLSLEECTAITHDEEECIELGCNRPRGCPPDVHA